MAQIDAATTEKRATNDPAPAPVVVGFDGSEEGRDALELARVLCEARGARCIVATVLEYGPVSVRRALSDSEQSEADAIFDEARHRLTGIEVDCRIAGTRSPARMLAEVAEREGAATLVVGFPHHRSRAGRALLGSVAEHLLHHSPCEVAIAPLGYGSTRLSHFGFDQVSVAFDGTEESGRALKGAEELARVSGATIQILVAEDPVVTAVEAEGQQEARHRGESVLAAAIESVPDSLQPRGMVVKANGRDVAPHIATALATRCDGDVLVCGRRSPQDRALLGSVTTHLLLAARCPVLIVPPLPG
ncbi:MAG TPA: universal stress protein [Solirubrobacterales bacterium]|jgi:nucleotide-binding universal stress UspA family protein